MMPLIAIDELKRTVSDAWDSPVADEVAAAWGYPPGTAKWWRSSASHVFVLPDPDGKRYLRFVPDAYAGAERFAAVSAVMDRLAGAGADVVRPVPARSGALTATVPTPLGPMHAMVVEAAPGGERDVEDLTEAGARDWGRALAAVHRAAEGIDVALPEAFTELAKVPDRFAGDPALVAAAARLSDRLAGLPRSGFGIVHGDFELDNLAWSGSRATAFDFDEAARSWYAADIAFALRDLTGPDGEPGAAHRGRFDAFLAGYRGMRPFGDDERAHLRLFAGVHAVCSLVRIAAAVEGAGGDGWMGELRSSLDDLSRSHRKLATAVAADL
ncbi:phosphotransferase enzyme family protein [Glycomyces albidus]|uniref:Phosphotransferase n=1 Tax=Glycomyces albidus TaxID=2656774 RepID=A0A6L5GD22_9ACTN|nr:phosphotransferase [Glycomyces albidus]MQM27597.1 phosphotransferase [Glycomyces albidus]